VHRFGPGDYCQPPVIASVGLPFGITEVTEEAIGQAKLNVGAYSLTAGRFLSRSDRFSVHLYAMSPGGQARQRTSGHVCLHR